MSNPDDYDEDADLEAGFEATITDEPTSPAASTSAPAAPTPSPAPAPSAEAPAPKPEDDVDQFAGYPPAVRELLGAVPKLMTEVADLRRTAGIVPGLQSEIARLKSERAAPPPPADAQPRKFEKVEHLRTGGLDDVADALDEIAAAIPRQAETTAPAAPAPAPASSAPAVDNDDPVIKALDAVRSDWSSTLFGTECQLWLSQQPAAFQQEMQTTPDPGVILRGLAKFDAFKATSKTTQQTQQGRTARMAAALTPRGDGRTSRAPAPLEDDEEADMQAGFASR